jgi:plasmid stability protein
MATVTVRGLDDGVKARLQAMAVRHGRSMEAEVRAILASAAGSSSAVARHLARGVAGAATSADWVDRARDLLERAWDEPEWDDDWLPARSGGARPPVDLG